MAFTLENPAEAYATVSLLIAGADGVGTVEERQFLFEKLSGVHVFAGQDAESMGCLLGTLTGRMFSELPNDGVALSTEAVGTLCGAAKQQLDDAQCGQLFTLAAELACCDGLEDVERTMLTRIADGLGVDAAVAQSTVERALGGN